MDKKERRERERERERERKDGRSDLTRAMPRKTNDRARRAMNAFVVQLGFDENNFWATDQVFREYRRRRGGKFEI
jgi:hypothetical protein